MRQARLLRSFAQVGVSVGVILANLLFLIITASVSPEALLNWAWHIPFLLSFLLVGLGIYIQFRLEDTPAFRHLVKVKEAKHEEAVERRADERRESVEEARQEIEAEKSEERSPIIEVLVTHPKEVLLASRAFIASNGTFYIFISFTIMCLSRWILSVVGEVTLDGIDALSTVAWIDATPRLSYERQPPPATIEFGV